MLRLGIRKLEGEKEAPALVESGPTGELSVAVPFTVPDPLL